MYRVYLCGPMDILKCSQQDTWEPIAKERWGSGKAARSVFKHLLAAPGRRLSRGKLQEDIWPALDFEASDKPLYNAISLIHGIIGKDLVKTRESTYELANQSLIWVDYEAARCLIESASNDHVQAIPALEEALSYLQRGEYLEREEGTWCLGLRQQSESMLRQCRLWLAEGYEASGKLWQASEQYRALLQLQPTDEDVLSIWMEMLRRHGKVSEARKCYQDIKLIAEAQGLTLSLPEPHEAPAFLSHQLALPPGADTFASAPAQLWADDLLDIYTRGVKACQDLYWSGSPGQVGDILPLYVSQISLFAKQSSPLQRPAARIASLAQQLSCELLTDREDYFSAQRAGQQAFQYGELAGDKNLQVAALISLGTLFFHRRIATTAISCFRRAIVLFDENVSPLSQGRTYAGVAEAYAMLGQVQEALRALGLAYESYPSRPEKDPAYSQLHSSLYSLRVFGDTQTRLFLGQAKEADKALSLVERESPDIETEPITRLDWIYYQAETKIQQGELEMCSQTLREAAHLAKDLGSRLYFNKLAVSYQSLIAHWPRERQVRELEEIFQPW